MFVFKFGILAGMEIAPGEISQEELFAKEAMDQCVDLIAANKDAKSKQSKIVQKLLIENADFYSAMDLNEDGSKNEKFQLTEDPDIAPFLRANLKGRVLDVGSGGKDELGDIVEGEVLYSDIVKFDQKNFVQMDASAMEFEDNEFDSIFARAVTQTDPGKILSEMLRVVKPGGNIVLDPHVEFVTDNLKALKDFGIDLDKQCSLKVMNSIRENTAHDFKFNVPSIYIVIKK